MKTLFKIIKYNVISKLSAKRSHKWLAKGGLLYGRKTAFVKEQLQLRTLLRIPQVSARTLILFVISVTPVDYNVKQILVKIWNEVNHIFCCVSQLFSFNKVLDQVAI